MEQSTSRRRLRRAFDAMLTGRTLAGAGVAHLDRPDRLVRAGVALRRWGPTPAAGYTASAARTPDRPAIDDELGTVSFGELHRRTNALADSLRDAGISEGDGVGILARNHRGFVEATVACSKLGAHALYLNTAFAGPQIAEVLARERPTALIHDEEFTELCTEAARGLPTFLAWHDPASAATQRPPTLEELIAAGRTRNLQPPRGRGKVVILTSGTTGSPKGASRRQPESLGPAAALLEKIPLRAREPTMIAAPMFHSWGFAHFTLALALSSTLVLRRRFDPKETLAAIERSQVTGLVVVPVMLQRILELGEKTIAEHDLGTLRVIAASGSALPGELAERTMDRFGEILYNLYGSTEVAWVTVATPAELRAAPGTAGSPPRGTTVRLYDEQDRPVGPGASGRIFVINELLFEGYTGGGAGKAAIDGLMSTGDVGHLDERGLLFVDGRDDEMIVSGGENVFPREVEDLLANHPEIDEAAVIGVPDERFGQGLKAFVVRRAGSELGVQAVKRHVKENLAAYKVPREVVFLDELPRTATGKVLKREL